LSSDPVASTAKGVTEGTLDWSAKKISELVKRFRDKEVAFIQDKKNIETVKQQRETEEYKLLLKYVGKERLLVLMGLALRSIEKNPDRVQDLRNKIHGKYGKKGVHVAELVQIGLVTELLTRLVKLFGAQVDIEKTLTSFLDQSEDLALFIKKEDSKRIDRISKLVMDRVDVNPVHKMILFGSGYAMDVVKAILKRIDSDPREYLIQAQIEGLQLSAFVYAPELRERLSHWSDTLPKSKRETKMKRR